MKRSDGARGHLKGSMFVSTFAFVEERFGAGGKERVLSTLAEPDRERLSGIVLPITWYPLDLFGRLLRTMDASLGQGDLALVVERGEWTAMRDIQTLRRAVLRFVSIPWVVSKAANLWPQFHDTGRWDVREVDENVALAELHELGVVDEAICASLCGWIRGLAKLTGASSPGVRHVACRARGDASCVFEVRWT